MNENGGGSMSNTCHTQLHNIFNLVFFTPVFFLCRVSAAHAQIETCRLCFFVYLSSNFCFSPGNDQRNMFRFAAVRSPFQQILDKSSRGRISGTQDIQPKRNKSEEIDKRVTQPSNSFLWHPRPCRRLSWESDSLLPSCDPRSPCPASE